MRGIRPVRAIAVAGLVLISGVGIVAGSSAAQVEVRSLPTAGTSVLHGQRLSLDGGALRVRPTVVAPAVHRSWAVFDLTHSNAGGAGFRPGRVLYGAVTITARRQSDPNSPGRYPSFHATPAWVLFYDPGASSCPVQPPEPPPRLPATASGRSVMVINARTGAALLYLGAGAGGCPAGRRPSVTKVAERVSVPWTVVDLPAGTPVDEVTAHYPGCAATFGAGGSSRPGTLSVLGVEVSRAFGPCHLAPRSVAVAISGFHFVAPLRHARIGPIATGQPAL